MKNSLWIIIALVTGIVGFLMGYSISSFTGNRPVGQVAAHGASAHDAAPAAAGSPAAQRPDAGGYAGTSGAAHDAKAGGYGAAAVPAAQGRPEKVPADKPKAAGY